MLLRSITFVLITLILQTSTLLADNIQRTKSAHGIVEFSNIQSANKTKKKQTIIYSYPQSDKHTIFTDQKPIHVANYKVLKFDCFACNPHSTINWHRVKLNLMAYAPTIKQASKQNHVDPALVQALIHAESGFKPHVVSQKGAQGLMQLMPATAKELGVKNALNPEQNINGGVKYLAQLLHEFNGDIKLATAAYNAGPKAVKKYHGIPPFEETQIYVNRVNILHQRYKNAS